jgi:6-phospho-3-hexuloisomerase
VTTQDSAATVTDLARDAVIELSKLVKQLDPDRAAAAADELTRAHRVFFTGVGRSGLVARALAIRLMHTGLQAFAVGEAATPAIAAGDLLVAVSAAGSMAVAEQAARGRRLGSRILAMTAVASGSLVDAADTVLLIPARSGVPTAQHAGSLFEQGCLVVGDALCAAVCLRLGVPESDLAARHANLP